MTLAFTATDLADLPRNLVSGAAVPYDGRDCLRVAPLPGLGPAQLIDKPSFVILPFAFTKGTVEVELLSRLAPDAPDFARAFAGLACASRPICPRSRRCTCAR